MASRQVDLQKLLADLNDNNVPDRPESRRNNVPQVLNDSPQHLHPHIATSVSGIPGLGLLQPEENPKFQTSGPTTFAQHSNPAYRSQLPQRARNPDESPSVDSALTSKPAIPDAPTITTWPAALKHVSKYLLPDEKFAQRIRGLIAEQRSLEEKWWSKRQAIEQMHAGRGQTSAAVASILRNLGGAETQVVASDLKSHQAELDTYDKQVHTNLMQMHSRFDKELRSLGVPFYVIKHDLVILEDGKARTSASQGRIDKGELRELQKRMLQTLEDLFGEDPG